jgi:hypothetical protein
LRVTSFAGREGMPSIIRPATSDLYSEPDVIVDREEQDDRLPINIAAPIIMVLSFSLWGGIGFVVNVLL